jgi:CRISPR type III-B/RAMP module RAMP protein Cmr6
MPGYRGNPPSRGFGGGGHGQRRSGPRSESPRPNRGARALVRQLGPVALTDQVVLARGYDQAQANGHVRFRLQWESPSFNLLSKQPNAALLYQRYNPSSFADFSELENFSSSDPQKDKTVEQAKKTWSQTAALAWFTRHCQNRPLEQELLAKLHERRRQVLRSWCARTLKVKSAGRLAVGLAHPAPFENAAWAFHHTYGFPVLPAASLKGLARHFLLEEWGWARTGDGFVARGLGQRPLREIEALSGSSWTELFTAWAAQSTLPAEPTAADLADLLFGGPAESSGEGALVFLDGWPLENKGWFELDVLAPHHLKYYGDVPGATPSDCDQPNPHHFVVLRESLTFEIPILVGRQLRYDGAAIQEVLLDAGAKILLAALAHWGIGAKTASGYGRMERLP